MTFPSGDQRGAVPRPSVFATKRAGAIRVHHKYLVAVATAVRGKRDPAAIRRPRRPAVEEWVVRKVARVRAIAIGNKNLRVLLSNDFAERDMFHIGRPRPIGIDPACDKGRDFLRGEINCVDVSRIVLRRFKFVIRAIDDAFAVRGPVWMDGILLWWCEHFYVTAISSHHRNAIVVLGDEDERDPGPIR